MATVPTLQPLARLCLHSPILFQPNRLHANKPRRVRRLEAPNLIHTRLLHIIQLLRLATPSQHRKAALVNATADLPIHALLARHNATFQKLALGRKVEPVVEDARVVEGDELVAQGSHLAVQHQALKVKVGGAQARQAGRLVAAARLEADEAVLDNVDAADAVAASEGVGGEEEVDGVGDGLGLSLVGVDEFGRDALFEDEDEVLGRVGRLAGLDRQLPHVVGRGGVGVLEDAGLVAAVGQVLVHGPGLGFGAGHGDLHLRGVVEQVVAAGEAVVEFGDAPGRDDLDGRLQGVEGQFEADLVVAFARAAVGDGDALFFLRDGDLTPGDDGPSEGGSLLGSS